MPKANISRGEYQLYQVLTKLQDDGVIYDFKQQFSGPLANVMLSGYDFAIYVSSDSNINVPDGFIEFDGDQHLKFNKYMHKTIEKFKNQQKVDNVKNEFAERASLLGLLRFSGKKVNKQQEDKIKKWIALYPNQLKRFNRVLNKFNLQDVW